MYSRYLLILLFLFISSSFDSDIQLNKTLVDEHDGRFTIGSDDKSILFGYPHNYSSSHFLITSNGKWASNNPAFYRKLVRYVSGSILENTSETGSTRSSTSYSFDNLSITQKLIPLNPKLQEVSSKEYGQFYRIEYEVTNNSDLKHDISMSLLLDLKLGDNDDVVAKCGGKLLAFDKRVEGNTPLDFAFEHNSKVIHVKQDTSRGRRANTACFGQWGYLKNVLDLNQHVVDHYTNDGALMLQWKASVQKDETVSFSIILSSNLPKLQAQHHNIKRVSKDTVYFAAGESNLDSASELRIQKFISSYRMRAVLIEGYTDGAGSAVQNLELAKKRIKSVSDKIQLLGIDKKNILIKSHGEFYAANHDPTSATTQTKTDRKVILTGWK
ncbi:MAG: hypothetical protein EAZ57_07060 [Cytophagales bacterium]|nr:MAG: hypothetical protein EAZ67_07870 [Cytophagales bacterium]TAF60461.1 MAG: hypothetical protein EAZ57_07060 [Cytophagales bacterium]